MNYKEIIDKDILEIRNKINFSEMKNKKILITGASGIVGIYLISSLRDLITELNLEVCAYVNNPLPENFVDIFKGIKVQQVDLSSDFSISDKFDYIIHAAGYGQPGKFLENKIKTIQLNTTATIKLLSMLNTDGKFLFISTSELYSGNDSENISEEQIGSTNTDHPRSCYIEGKRCGESICFSQNNPNIKIARLSLAYGPGTKPDDKRVLNQLIEKALTDDSINLVDSGSAMRTYCYITDAVEMFWNILLNSKSNLYNVGGFSKVSILDLAKSIGVKLNKKVFFPESDELTSVGNPKLVNISIEKYLSEFNKTEFIDLDDGLDRTILWQKQIYNNEQNNL
jgi:nucleoside-diphosphate-sugar epimerase